MCIGGKYKYMANLVTQRLNEYMKRLQVRNVSNFTIRVCCSFMKRFRKILHSFRTHHTN